VRRQQDQPTEEDALMAKFQQASARIGPDPQLEPELCGIFIGNLRLHGVNDFMAEVRCNEPRNHGQRSIKGNDVVIRVLEAEEHMYTGEDGVTIMRRS
jgi:hypothetical protein